MQITNLSNRSDATLMPVNDTRLLFENDISMISSAVSTLPVQWFRPSLIADHDASDGEVFNYVVLTQTSGPSFGLGFAIERHGRRYLVTNSAGVSQEPEVVASAGSAGDAVGAIGRLIEKQLSAWGVRPVAG